MILLLQSNKPFHKTNVNQAINNKNTTTYNDDNQLIIIKI